MQGSKEVLHSLAGRGAEKILGTGIDLVFIPRIKRLAEKERFLARVFTEDEIRYCTGKRRPERHLAGRFAAKEACMKALGTGLTSGVKWKDIEVVNPGDGRAELRLCSIAEKLLKGRRPLLSIAYEEDLAVAFVVIE